MDSCLRDLHQKNQTAILRALAEKSQSQVALMIGMSESALSRAKDGDIDRLSALLAACDLVVVPRAFKVVSPTRLKALEILALEGLQHTAGDSGFGDLR